MSNRSKIVTTVGSLLAIFGAYYLYSPPPDDAGIPTRDEFLFLLCGWLIISGIGLIAHKKSAFWFYLGGIAIFAAAVARGAYGSYGQISDAVLATAFVLIPFGFLAVLIWIRKDYLQPWWSEETNDA